MAGQPAGATPAEHQQKARSLVAQAHAKGGMVELDIEKFWADQEAAAKDPFSAACPQVPMDIFQSSEVIFDELAIPEDFWRMLHDDAWRIDMHKAYNDKAEKIIGRRPLSEVMPPPSEDRYPQTRELHDIFEGQYTWHGWSWWLGQVVDNQDDLARLLDRVEKRLENLRDFMLPPGWDKARDRLMARGIKPTMYRGQRGPCTFACSVFGPENTVMLCLDNPSLAGRFRDAILHAMLERARVLDEEAGYTPETAPRGWAFLDDNSCLFNPDLYEFFGAPILRGMFARYSPGEKDRRYQHSDSAMAHLLPILGTMRMTRVNFGPTLTVREIRNHCPHAVIEGQLAPFTFSRNEEEKMVLELLRDFDQARERRGLMFATAGSINNGSRLTGMRLLMAAAQRWCRYK